MASSSAIMAGMAYVKLTADSAELQRGLQNAQGKLQNFAKSVETLGSKMAIFGTLAGAPLAMAAKTFADFDDQMRLVAAVTGAAGKDFDMLTEKAKKLGRETSFTAQQVASGMTALGRMGFNPQEIDAAIAPMMNLARTTGTELSEASEIAANNLRVFGMEANKSSYMADILMVTANGSAQTLTDLGESLKMAGPQAAAAGADIKEVCGALGVMANLGIKGSLAGTALRKAYSRFADTKVQDYLRQYNIETVDANGNLRKMTDVIYDISKAMQKMGTAQKIAFAENVFDIRGSLAGLSLTADTSKIDEFKAKLDEAAGSSADAAAKMEAGLGGAFRRLMSAVEGMSIAFGDAISSSLAPLMDAMAAAAIAVAEWITENSVLVTTFAGIVAGAAAVGTAIKVIAVAGRGLAAVFSPITAILKTLDAIASGSRKAAAAAKGEAAAALVAEKQKELATQTAAAKRTAADAKRHLAEMQNAATEADTTVAAEKKKLNAAVATQTAKQRQIAIHTQNIAAIEAEAAKQVAAEKQKIAAITATGSASKAQIAESTRKIAAIQAEATAQVKAETEKKVAVATTNAELSRQIAIQKASVASAEAGAAVAAKNLSTASTQYGAATAAVAAATAAEGSFAAANTASAAIMARKQKIVAGLITHKFALAITSETVGNVIRSANIKTLATEMAVAAGAKGVTIAFYAKAVAAKVAAGAMALLRAAMTAIAAHPVTAALAALVLVLGSIYYATGRANQNFRAMAESAKKASEAANAAVAKGDTERQAAEVDFTRLKQLEELSQRRKLTTEEFAEAERLMKSLAPYGSAHFAQLDKNTKQLRLAADAQNQFNEAMKRAAKMQIEAEIAELRAERKALEAENEQLLSYWNYTFFADISGKSDAAIKQIEVNGNRAVAIMQRINAAQERLNAMQQGDKNAVTGRQEEENTQEKVDEYNERKQASVEALAAAEKELARIEEENERKRRSALENEIADIQKLRAEYMKNAQLKLDAEKAELDAAKRRASQNAAQTTPEQKKAFEEAQRAAEEHAKNIESLEARIAAAEASFSEQVAQAQAKDRQRRKKAAAPYENFLANNEEQERRREESNAVQNRFDNLAKDTSEAGKLMMAQFIAAQELALQLAKEDYTKTLRAAQSESSEDGSGLSKAERESLDDQQRQITERQRQLSSFRDQIVRAATEATSERNKPQTKALAAFDARALTSIFSKSGFAAETKEERIARATEATAKYTRELTHKRVATI